jgi:hypothetical protein
MLWAVAASAGTPIVYGRFRLWSGALPKDTYKKSEVVFQKWR